MNTGQQWVYENIERPLPTIIARMERHGVLLDQEKLLDLGQQMDRDLRALEEGALAGVNPRSPAQVRRHLHMLGLPDQGSTDEAALKKLKALSGHPFLDALLKHREVSKIKGTYVEGLLSRVAPDNRIHTSLHQVGTETGRMSSSNPNMQNIPAKDPYGPAIRQAIIAPPGHVLIAVDYSQIELRVIAAMSREPTLCEAFARGEDVHMAVTLMMGLQKEERRKGKNLNFATIYGQEGSSLALALEVSKDEADRLLALYWERLPYVRKLVLAVQAFAITHGYVETMFGRRNYVTIPHSQDRIRRAKVLREAVNMPVQGTAADIMKLFMQLAYYACQQYHAHPILQVHDELVVECPADAAEALSRRLVDLGCSVADIGVPLDMAVGWGTSWQDAKH